MLDVGTHCFFCREVDFLPFRCSACNKEFCAKHRSKESHYCEALASRQQQSPAEPGRSDSNTSSGQYFQSLLPEKAHLRIKSHSDKNHEPVANAKNTLLNTNNASALSAVDKLKKFFAKNGKVFNNKKSVTKLSSANKLISVTKMKRTAKGDPAIPLANRIYVWCYVVDSTELSPVANEVFINKMWPIGRALDSIASVLNIKNANIQHTVSDKERLFLYKGDSDLSQLLPASARVANTVKEGDTLYIVRGQDTTLG